MKDGGFRKVQQILLVVLLLNLLVAGAKIFVGSVIKSAGMTADGFIPPFRRIF